MALTFLDKATIRSYLTAMWKKEIGTEADPANGKWWEDSPNHDGRGLYGGLIDMPATEVQFDEAKKRCETVSLNCDSWTIDNLDGLHPSETVKWSYAFTRSTSTTHTTTDSIKAGVGLEIKAKATILGVGADLSAKFSFDYTHSWGTSSTETKIETSTISGDVPVPVPKGKVYQVVLTKVSQELIVPYTVTVAVSGITETWFHGKKKYNWQLSASDAFSRIGKWGLAGPHSASYTAAGVTQTGTVITESEARFNTVIYDITKGYKPGQRVAIRRSTPVLLGGTSPAPVQGVLVKEIPVSGIVSRA